MGSVAVAAAPFEVDPSTYTRDVVFYLVAAMGVFSVCLNPKPQTPNPKPQTLNLTVAGLHTGWPSLTAVPVWDHLWPRRATFFPPRMDHLFRVDHLFSTLYRSLGPPETFGW